MQKKYWMIVVKKHIEFFSEHVTAAQMWESRIFYMNSWSWITFHHSKSDIFHVVVYDDLFLTNPDNKIHGANMGPT